jgi:hypothetical protein
MLDLMKISSPQSKRIYIVIYRIQIECISIIHDSYSYTFLYVLRIKGALNPYGSGPHVYSLSFLLPVLPFLGNPNFHQKFLTLGVILSHCGGESWASWSFLLGFN